MTCEFHSEHLFAFQNSLKVDFYRNEAGGKNVQNFASGLPGVVADKLPNAKLDRDGILNFIENQNLDISTNCAVIMAWGGMRSTNAAKLFNEGSPDWLHLADKIRGGELDRAESYSEFCGLQQADKIPGMGPAYFTKLIYFLMPRNSDVNPPGYIMDQWAACSINLLSNKPIIYMDANYKWKKMKAGTERVSSFTVSNVNTFQNYEKFCNKIDSLSVLIKKNADATDRALVSNGGRKPEEWRKYVIQHRSL